MLGAYDVLDDDNALPNQVILAVSEEVKLHLQKQLSNISISYRFIRKQLPKLLESFSRENLADS